MESCYFGTNGNCGECHKLSYSRKEGFKHFKDFDAEQLEVLFLRADIPYSSVDFSSIQNLICYHHYNLLMNKFQYRHNHCCDPFGIHKDATSAGRKLVSLNLAKQLNSISQKNIKPGYKLCPRCQTQTNERFRNPNFNELEFTLSTSDSTDSETMDLVKNASFNEKAKEDTNKSLAAIGESPIKLHSLPKRMRSSYCAKKLKTASKSIAISLAEAACVNIQDIVHEDDGPETKLQKLESTQQDLNNLMEELKTKFNLPETSNKEKIQILTLQPSSWTTNQIMEYFNCSKYLVNKAAAVKKESGILAIPVRKQRQGISYDTKAKVLCVYEDDENSRLMPGVKDKVSIGRHSYHQKRLLLCTVREMYAAFQMKYPDAKIGLSRFFELKPKWCVAPGSSGTHKVCVCSIHQNVVLLADVCGISYREMMAKVVCDINSKICMVHRCSDCPGENALKEILNDKFEESNGNIQFQQWESTDRAQIITVSLPVEDFIERVVKKISNLTAHSFIAKCQSKYLKTRKESLQNYEAIVLLDFAENYQFVIQDEIQSFHWSKEYCTVHPVVLYYTKDAQLIELSFCILSDDAMHDTSFVWKLQEQVTHYIKEKSPYIQAIEYFSDGCAGEYKNFKNFLNLTHHEADCNLRACWSFFATSHGKSPCDGIGGVVKRKLANVSLTRKASNPILSSQSAYVCCQRELKSIIFFHLSKQDINQARAYLSDRYLKGSTVIGTRSFHHFYPLEIGVVGFKRISDDENSAGSHCFYITPPSYSLNELPVMSYIACKYDELWWVGMILDVDHEKNDLQVSFMHPHRPSKSFSWPRRDDVCWIPPVSVILKLNPPTTTNGRNYTIDNQAVDNIAKILMC